MKVVAYLRVSTDRQAEQGYGLDVQESAIKKWARANAHKVVGWYRDEGVSGSNGVEGRLALHDALTAVEQGHAGGLVVYRLDRLARKLTIQEATLAKLWDMGAEVFSVDIGEVTRDDPDDPMKTALRQMIGVFAQLERGMIAARLRSGRALKGERGGYAFGRPPFGKRAEAGELVVDEAEQETLARMRELRAAGASYRAIAATLTAEGRKPKQGEVWHNAQVRAILTR